MTNSDYSKLPTTFQNQIPVNYYIDSLKGCAHWFYASRQESMHPQSNKKIDTSGTVTHKNAKILIVDDNKESRKMLTTFLSRYGFTIVQADNGLEAMRQFHKERFDIIITDICMPGMNGNILTKQIKNIASTIPVIAITGSPSLVENYFDKVLAKPFSLEIILESIQTCLSPKTLYPRATRFSRLKNKLSRLKII